MKKSELKIRNIFDRIRKREGVQSDSDLGDILNISPRNIVDRKQRNSIPWEELHHYSQMQQIPFDWLINGENTILESGAIYTVSTNQDIVYTLASQIYQLLQDDARILSAEKFQRVIQLLHREILDHELNGVSPEKMREVIRLAE